MRSSSNIAQLYVCAGVTLVLLRLISSCIARLYDSASVPHLHAACERLERLPFVDFFIVVLQHPERIPQPRQGQVCSW